MKALTKAQTEALVEEIQDRLKGLTENSVLPKRAESEWEKLKTKIEKHHEMEEEIEKLDEKLDQLRDERRDYEKSLEDQIKKFETRHGVEVRWQYIDYDEGETPSIEFPAKDFKDKIARQISILSIDKKGNLSADDIISHITQKLSI